MDKFQSVPALDLCCKIFFYTPPMVIKWSESNKQFKVQNEDHWGYWVWRFNIFTFVFLIGFGSCVDVMTHRDEAGDSLFILACLLASLSFLIWTSDAVLDWNADQIVLGITHLENILKYHENLQNNRNPTTRASINWHIISYAIKLAVETLAVIPFTLSPLLVWADMDPFYYTFPKLIPSSKFCGPTSNLCCISFVHGIQFICRAVSVIICVFEACRFFAVLFCMLIYTLELFVKCIEVITRVHLVKFFVRGNQSFSKWYVALRVAYTALYSPLSSIFALILGDGFFILVFTNVAIVKAYNILPFEVYWLLPVVSIILSCFLAFSFPFTVKVYKLSGKMIHIKKAMISYNPKFATAVKRKLEKKETATVRPVSISCGGLFELERGSESTYFNLVIMRTVDGLLL